MDTHTEKEEEESSTTDSDSTDGVMILGEKWTQKKALDLLALVTISYAPFLPKHSRRGISTPAALYTFGPPIHQASKGTLRRMGHKLTLAAGKAFQYTMAQASKLSASFY